MLLSAKIACTCDIGTYSRRVVLTSRAESRPIDCNSNVANRAANSKNFKWGSLQISSLEFLIFRVEVLT